MARGNVGQHKSKFGEGLQIVVLVEYKIALQKRIFFQPINIAHLHEQHEVLRLSFFVGTCHPCSGSADLSDSKMESISIDVNTMVLVGDDCGVEEAWPFFLVFSLDLVHCLDSGAPFEIYLTSNTVKLYFRER